MYAKPEELRAWGEVPEAAAELAALARGLCAGLSVEEMAALGAELAAEWVAGSTAWVVVEPSDPAQPWPMRGAASTAGEAPPAIPSDDPLLYALRAQPSPRRWPIERAPWAQRRFGGADVWALPLVASGRTVGALLIAGAELPRRRLPLLEVIAAQVALAIDHARLAADERAREAQVEVLSAMARSIASTLERDRLLQLVVAQVRRLAPCEHASIAIAADPGGALTVAAVDGPLPVFAIGERLPVDGIPAARGSHDLAEADGPLAARLLAAGLRSFVTVPIAAAGALVGELCAASRAPRAFAGGRSAVLGELAPHIGVALRNAGLYADLQQSLRDLTRTQEQLVRAERLRALGEMASGVAHDFNNVLNAILHRAALTAADAPPPVREGLQRIEATALRGAETVRRLQDFTRQRRDTDFVPVDVGEVITEATRVARATQVAAATALHVDVSVAPGLPRVLGAHDELVEVVGNLVGNALDAMPGGGHLAVSARADGDRAIVMVRDDGCGMDAATRDRAFDPFFTTKGVQGTGLGLSVVYGLVERHRGTVTLESALGVGTTVTVVLPALDAAVPSPAAAQKSLPRTPLRAAAATARVLLIEDDAINREATRALLEFAGYEVTDAATGLEGIERFRPDAFDLVLSDLGMPDRNGWEVARAVKDLAPSTPVALITGWGLTISDEEGARRGVDVVIKKPVPPQKLLEILAELLAR